MKRLIIKLLALSFLIVKLSEALSQPQVKATAKRYIPSMHTKVTFMGFGALEIGRDWGIGNGAERQHVSQSQAGAVLTTVLQQGINVIDTAASYQFSEEYIGTCKACKHNKFLLSTKAGESSVMADDPQCKQPTQDGIYCADPAARYDFSRKAIRRDVENSLKKLRTDRIDIVFIHFDSNPKKILDQGEAVAVLKELKQEGKIRYIGASLDDPEQVKRCISSGDFDAVQFEYNLLNQSNKENIALAHSKGLGVFVRGGLGTGLLTSRVAPYLDDRSLPYRKQLHDLLVLTHGNFQKLTALALAFLYQHEGISTVIIGSKNPQHVKQNIELLDSFKDNHLLAQAETLMAKYKPEKFTNAIDNYFAKQQPAHANKHMLPTHAGQSYQTPGITYH